MAVGLALAAGASNAVVIDGQEGIGDFVWDDLDRDGVQDAGELGIPGVTVNLYQAAGLNFVDSTVTDALGEYVFSIDFDNPLAGVSLIVEFNLPVGYVFTVPNAGADDTIGSDVIDFVTGRTGPVSYTEFDYNLTVDAGAYRDAAVPEPGPLALLAVGMAGLGWASRRKSDRS